MTSLDPRIFNVLAWAGKRHNSQPYGRNEYWPHLVAVLSVALEHGVRDTDTLLACVCHDILEDTLVTEKELAERTNEVVVDLVRQCTFKQETRESQLEAIAEAGKTMTPRAMIVKCCDTIANIMSFGSDFTPEEAAQHKWTRTYPYRIRFANGYLERLKDLGRPLREAEKTGKMLAEEIKARLTGGLDE